MSSTSSLPYREQVNETLVALSNIGKPVWVLFQHGKSHKQQFFRGEITELNMKKLDNETDGISGAVDIEHFVVFDDGDKDWYNLAEKEDAGQLLWQEPTEEKVLMLMKARRVKSSPVGNEKGKKNKRKKDVEVETDDEYNEDGDCDDDDEILDELNNGKKRARVSSSSSVDFGTANKNNEQEQEQAASRQFQALDRATKKWFKSLGLTKENSYGARHDALDIILDNESKYEMPEAFEQLFFLVDFLFPGKNYHQTLYASFTHKPGKPVRDVLLDLKRENPQDPLISWHEKCGRWIPPTASVCVGMVKLIQEMI